MSQLSKAEQEAMLTQIWEDKPIDDDPEDTGYWQFGTSHPCGHTWYVICSPELREKFVSHYETQDCRRCDPDAWDPLSRRSKERANAHRSASNIPAEKDEPTTRKVEVTLRQVFWDRIERLIEADPNTQDMEHLLETLLDHVQQGVYRSAAWEREWLSMVCGPDVVEQAAIWEEDPLYLREQENSPEPKI